jgi:hypothetical protein
MDEDEPGAVDARSIYIGNVRGHLLQSISSSYRHIWISVPSQRSQSVDRRVFEQ